MFSFLNSEKGKRFADGFSMENVKIFNARRNGLTLGGRNISDDHLREFLRHSEIIAKYPEVLPKLMKQRAFKARLKRIQIRLFGKEGE